MLACAVGCGPVEYISQVTRRASDGVAAAKSVNADKYAPYEYTSAVEYLHKAREEEGYADHQAAVRFGKLAEDMADKARKKALAEQGGGNSSTTAPSPAGEEGAPVIEAPDDPHDKGKGGKK